MSVLVYDSGIEIHGQPLYLSASNLYALSMIMLAPELPSNNAICALAIPDFFHNGDTRAIHAMGRAAFPDARSIVLHPESDATGNFVAAAKHRQIKHRSGDLVMAYVEKGHATGQEGILTPHAQGQFVLRASSGSGAKGYGTWERAFKSRMNTVTAQEGSALFTAYLGSPNCTLSTIVWDYICILIVEGEDAFTEKINVDQNLIRHRIERSGSAGVVEVNIIALVLTTISYALSIVNTHRVLMMRLGLYGVKLINFMAFTGGLFMSRSYMKENQLIQVMRKLIKLFPKLYHNELIITHIDSKPVVAAGMCVKLLEPGMDVIVSGSNHIQELVTVPVAKKMAPYLIVNNQRINDGESKVIPLPDRPSACTKEHVVGIIICSEGNDLAEVDDVLVRDFTENHPGGYCDMKFRVEFLDIVGELKYGWDARTCEIELTWKDSHGKIQSLKRSENEALDVSFNTFHFIPSICQIMHPLLFNEERVVLMDAMKAYVRNGKLDQAHFHILLDAVITYMRCIHHTEAGMALAKQINGVSAASPVNNMPPSQAVKNFANYFKCILPKTDDHEKAMIYTFVDIRRATKSLSNLVHTLNQIFKQDGKALVMAKAVCNGIVPVVVAAL